MAECETAPRPAVSFSPLNSPFINQQPAGIGLATRDVLRQDATLCFDLTGNSICRETWDFRG